MTAISQSKCYEIIQNFAETIKERKVQGAKPEKTVIFFRNEANDQRQLFFPTSDNYFSRFNMLNLQVF